MEFSPELPPLLPVPLLCFPTLLTSPACALLIEITWFLSVMGSLKASYMPWGFLIIWFSLTYLVPNQFNQKRSEEHTSELQSRGHLVCRLLLEKKKKQLI